MASTFTSVQFMDPPGGPGVLGAIKAGSGITISPDGTISTSQGGGIVETIQGTNGIVTAGSTNVIVSLNPPTSNTIGGVRTVAGSGIAIDSQGIIRSAAEYTIFPGAGISVTNSTPISSTVSVLPAGTVSSQRGGVWISAGSGLSVDTSGSITLTPATTTRIGGVKIGDGLQITPDGTLSAPGGIGTITQVLAGTGLSGGGTSGAVTLNLVPPTGGNIGGVKAGSGISIGADGTLSVVGVGTVTQVTGNAPISVINNNTTPIVSVLNASTTSPGVVQLVDSPSSSSISQAPTANALSIVNALAAAALPQSGGTITGPLTINTGGTPGSNALTVSGGNLVLSTSFTPANSSASGSVGELAWDATYLYFCYAPNTWGRVQIDLTPF